MRDAVRLQIGGYTVRGPSLLEAKFGMLMKFVS
jgi:hypothetical protein